MDSNLERLKMKDLVKSYLLRDLVMMKAILKNSEIKIMKMTVIVILKMTVILKMMAMDLQNLQSLMDHNQ